ncbi:prenyltransferase [Natribacillus halophilus]|uniref:1,4-dihydroxy-2-naphthoate octaprenyltransferase n=1 Tax=Natribacillus halophilus TaxID=549003 RepID=A0A1G8Q9H3_9BACI|nr:prenyltransferase [Natribacillus halophilus]SDJ01422.1 1,4-dihydroxy-2-naphthoate octaprenyltransferase [Natribacillus halophilus]
MATRALSIIQGSWQLLRMIAVASSSFATIISTMLPLFLYYTLSPNNLLFILLILITGAIFIHGLLTHLLNDVSDYKSGTDALSPAILSGGSRVTQDGMISIESMEKIGKWLAFYIILISIPLVYLGYYQLSILLLIGVWAAASYSLPPLQLSYRPFLGEIFSLFPAMVALGLAGAWLALDEVPVWALQNATINALICVAWVMVHHIPDREADKQAHPTKQTSIVWSVEKFGESFSRFPALLYLLLTGLCVFWLGMERLWAALGVLVIVTAAITLVANMNIKDDQQVSTCEKILLLFAVITAVWLGVFI